MTASDPSPLDAPALVVRPTRAARVTVDGVTAILTHAEARAALAGEGHILCHVPQIAHRLALAPDALHRRHADILDLFAFTLPARQILPAPPGLARALGLRLPDDIEEEAALLLAARDHLLDLLAGLGADARARAASIAAQMRGAWAWDQAVAGALDSESPDRGSLAVWVHLPQWEEKPPRGQPGSRPVAPDDTSARLHQLLGRVHEPRPQQAAYARLAAAAFAPREAVGAPHVVLAEAGTGTGKTAGYLAPASLWAERNGGAVWISTYTKNLQRQIDQELARLYPDPSQKADKAVVRKGRENYLCLLNYQEATQRQALAAPRQRTVLGLVARWISATRDGDILGGDLPPWLAAEALPFGLTDRRGECVYSACMHYRTCFIEANQRKARTADLVIANHALVMVQAAREPAENGETSVYGGPVRLVFDEGHHLFAAADSTFASHLTGREGADLRRWVKGREGGDGRRGRGLAERLSGLISGDAAEALLEAAERAAQHLAGPGFAARIEAGQPRGTMERFLALVRAQVLARSTDADADYDVECAVDPPIEGLVPAAEALAATLRRLAEAFEGLEAELRQTLDAEAETLDTPTRARIEALARGLRWRAGTVVRPWAGMAAHLGQATPEGFVDWLGLARAGGRDIDCGMYRHWVDPTIPFAAAVLRPAHGVLITSASLTDRLPDTQDDTRDWTSAEARTGAQHLALPAQRGRFASPFDFARQARVLLVRDVTPRDISALAAAMRELILAAGGGALGLFTAVRTLRGVHRLLAPALDAAGLTLLAQHVDPYDMGLLVDLFRAEDDACLLGTDAARDGLDVPGRSLRLVMFDRVPWPRPDLLFQARKARFGGAAYVDMTTRFRLTQAFGRLIRSAEDRGVFVMLDPRCPSRLLSGLPPEVPRLRCGLAEAIAETRRFLGSDERS